MARRRGLATALQTALSAAAGGLSGYAQQQEIKKRDLAARQAQEEREAERARMLRGEAREIVRLGGKPIAQAGQEVAGTIPSAVPLTAPGLSALDAAMAAGGPSTSRGAFRQELPGIGTFMLPSAEEQQAKETQTRKSEIEEERAWRSEEAKLQRDFTAQQNRLDRQAKQGASQIGEISPVIARNASTLRDDYRAEPAVKNSEIIARQTRIVQAAAKRQDPASDLSLIFAYMKVLDPGSVVREREFANAQNAASVPDQVRNLYNRVLRGTRLNPTQRSQFLSSAMDIAQTQRAELQAQNQRYSAIATRYGVPSDLVIYDPFETLFPETEEAGQQMTVPPPVTVPAESTSRGRPPIGSFQRGRP